MLFGSTSEEVLAVYRSHWAESARKMLETVVTLRIIQHDVGSSSIRHDRRAYLSPDLLRTYKLAAGEWAILSDRQEAQRFVIAQLWPKLSLEDDGQYDPTLLG